MQSEGQMNHGTNINEVLYFTVVYIEENGEKIESLQISW